MAWTVSAIVLLVFVSAVVAALVCVFAFRKRPDPMAWPMTVLMGASAVWAGLDGISMANTAPGWVLFWTKLTVPVAIVVPVAYLVIALRYAGYEKWCTRRVYALLGTAPAITVPFAWQYPATQLYWTGHETQTVYGAAVFIVQRGPMSVFLIGYLYLTVVAGLFLFATVAVRAGTIHRKQSLLMFTGGVVPFIINAGFILGVTPIAEIDFTTTTIIVSGVTFAAVLFHYQTLDLSPAAYRNVPALFEDGVVVFDDERRLVEANDHAAEILDTDLELRTPADELFDSPLETLDRTVIEVAEPNEYYNRRYAPLRNYQDEVVGHVLVMREISELKSHEQRLDVTNRILRHNLRNELNIILGRLDLLEEQAEVDDHLEEIRGALTRLRDASEKARDIQSSLRDDGETYPVDVVPLVRSVLDRYREAHPNATLDCDLPPAATVLATSDTALETVLKNLVENSIEHNDTDHPQVEVTIERGEGTVSIHITDNGPGIPDSEREVLERGGETQLDHGSGLGLWLVYWFVTSMDGDIEFTTNEPRGTVVTIRLAAASPPDHAEQPIQIGE